MEQNKQVYNNILKGGFIKPDDTTNNNYLLNRQFSLIDKKQMKDFNFQYGLIKNKKLN